MLDPAAQPSRPQVARWAAYGLGAAAAAGLLMVIFPVVSGAPWRSVATTVASIPGVALAGLVLLWLAGLGAHTATLTPAPPRRTPPRAVLLRLTGGAGANGLPPG